MLLGFSFYSWCCSGAISVAEMVLGIFNRSDGQLSLTVNELYFYISVSENSAAGYGSMLAPSSKVSSARIEVLALLLLSTGVAPRFCALVFRSS